MLDEKQALEEDHVRSDALQEVFSNLQIPLWRLLLVFLQEAGVDLRRSPCSSGVFFKIVFRFNVWIPVGKNFLKFVNYPNDLLSVEF